MFPLIFYFYLLNVFLGAWIILNYFSHTVFVLFLSAPRFQGWLCRAAHGGFTAQNPRGSLHIYLLSVAYFHTVTHCGLICRLPPETQCKKVFTVPSSMTFLGRSLVTWNAGAVVDCGKNHSHTGHFIFPPHRWRHAEYVPLLCFCYCPSYCLAHVGLRWGFRGDVSSMKSQECIFILNENLLMFLSFSCLNPCLCLHPKPLHSIMAPLLYDETGKHT